MCKVVEELCKEEKLEAAKRFLEYGTLTVEEIAKGLGLTVEEVKKLAEQK